MFARKTVLNQTAALLAMAVFVSATSASAQRDPAYAAARAGGAVGERMDGYLGIVGAPTADLRQMVADLNIRRKQVYFEQAQEQRVTAEQYAFSAGCKAIDRTAVGEKYQAPDGSWATRTAGLPKKHPQCP